MFHHVLFQLLDVGWKKMHQTETSENHVLDSFGRAGKVITIENSCVQFGWTHQPVCVNIDMINSKAINSEGA